MSRISVNGLKFHYHAEEPVLKNICLEFDHRSTAIIGQNGAGKTTLVKLLKGLLKPVEGEITIQGINTKSVSVAHLASKIGLVFQNPNDQIFKNKVLDEVMFGPMNIGKSKDEAYQSALDALAISGLSDKHDANPYDLSLSERKMVSVASIIAMDTEIIIFDEPTIAQDHRGRERMKEIIKRLSSQGKLVVTIIHDMDFVAEVFERTIVLSEGVVILDGPTGAVFAQKEKLEQSYLEQPHVTQLCRALGEEQVFLTVEAYIDYKTTK